MIDFIVGLIVLLNVRHFLSSFGIKIWHVSFFIQTHLTTSCGPQKRQMGQ